MKRYLAVALLVALAGCATRAPAPRAQPQPPVRQVVLPAPVAGPTDTSLFGIVLNKPFGGMGECPVGPSILNRGELDYGIGFVRSTCYRRFAPRIGTGAPLANEQVFVKWPLDVAPLMATGGSVGVLILDGIVQAITFNTGGVSTQNSDLAQLTEKFGKPASRDVEAKQNRMGAKFDVVSAVWSRPDGNTITYFGAITRLDEGMVIATTPRGAEHRRKAFEQLRPNEQKL